ncbi:MAG: helix-turn-helix domain-containing protein [Ancrocorticia sp.]
MDKTQREREQLGSFVRQQRVGRRLTQEELAFAASVSKDTIRRLEQGASSTRLDNLLAVLRVFNLDKKMVQSINPLLDPDTPLNSLRALDMQRVRRRKDEW